MKKKVIYYDFGGGRPMQIIVFNFKKEIHIHRVDYAMHGYKSERKEIRDTATGVWNVTYKHH